MSPCKLTRWTAPQHRGVGWAGGDGVDEINKNQTERHNVCKGHFDVYYHPHNYSRYLPFNNQLNELYRLNWYIFWRWKLFHSTWLTSANLLRIFSHIHVLIESVKMGGKSDNHPGTIKSSVLFSKVVKINMEVA